MTTVELLKKLESIQFDEVTDLELRQAILTELRRLSIENDALKNQCQACVSMKNAALALVHDYQSSY
ncbi:hypothetical protein HQ393_04765 [Chitinibacter bivalviorum]|uniref:Uncharacterized protein n=1 Tax=Chitinibacter bivalviorum TaxID=2739434 RepID=A0A7H9BI51_9NEIS|nr:hypothetical protein [Chitinibacter bivalviorum]QLG87621.1 hypothetical protein HQ393_04765 [Chitinibacter bivalviorum]